MGPASVCTTWCKSEIQYLVEFIFLQEHIPIIVPEKKIKNAWRRTAGVLSFQTELSIRLLHKL